MNAPLAVAVVVPARDEERRLPACLASIATARARLARERPEVACSVTVSLDDCADGSAAVVAAYAEVDAEVHAVTLRARCAGGARRAGVRAAAQRYAGLPAKCVWVANTDADTEVPAHWLTEQVRMAEEGFALVVGTVQPDRRDLPLDVVRAWARRHDRREGHRHVHGANLGLTLRAYLDAGGFPPVPQHEDVVLVRAVQDAGVPWRATHRIEVVTSGRLRGRTPDGFAGFLRSLETATALHPGPEPPWG